jgi:cytochrome c peroxidase
VRSLTAIQLITFGACVFAGLYSLRPAASARATSADVPFYATRFERRPSVAEAVTIGRAIFFDTTLSASRRMSCATCHDSRFAFGPPADAPATGRSIPALRYLARVPTFSEHFFEDDGNDSVDQGPTGGLMWDGRAESLHDQASLPMLSPLEMANASPAEVVAKVAQAPYAPEIRSAFGRHVLDDPKLGFRAITLALEYFQQQPREFYPYDSRYDASLRHETTLTPAETRGLALFNDPRKGNCASCHVSTAHDGPAQFSDWGFIALGVPRNRALAPNRDPAYFDLGLCGPIRSTYASRPDYCGLFRTPTLRNVAVRRTFFHNAAVHDLRDAVRFYVERDTRPERWYPIGATGRVEPFDDLPEAYRGNVNREPPFGGMPGGAPALTEAEIDDVVAFLRTLTDRDLAAPR